MLPSFISRVFGWYRAAENPQNGQEQPASQAAAEGQTDSGHRVSPVDNVQPQLQAATSESRQPSPLLPHPDDYVPEVKDITPKDLFAGPYVEPDYPTLNLVPKDLRPGFWMGRGLVSLWCWAHNLHRAHCELVYLQSYETEENARDLYLGLMELRREYLTYLHTHKR